MIETVDFGSDLSSKQIKDIFSVPNGHLSEEVRFNLYNLKRIAKALGFKLFAESTISETKFVLLVPMKIQVPQLDDSEQ